MLACEIGLLAALLMVPGTSADTGGALARALVSPDRDAISTIGARTGAAGLTPVLAAGTRRQRVAACRAAPSAPDAWALVEPLAKVAGGADRALAVEAARAASAIAAALDRDALLAADAPDDEVRAALGAWRAVGADAHRWPDVRVHALEIGRDLAVALGPDAQADAPFDAAARVADAEPEVRRAALELLPARNPPLALAASALADPDPTVAVAAAQAMCAGLALGDDAKPVLAAAGAAGLERMRAMVVDAKLSAPARLDTARCLVADGAAKSITAARRFAATAPRSIRADAARAIRGRR